ncbi:DUF445 domain-containing protein [Hydrogenophaga sp. 5NK40-0174]|uniref:DUF445 domain-containing protein n=1 Tax=Hydrogenophaga sp. 5NK40-0174 TaxID=3127649 RepID=UPI00333FA8F9
MPNRLSLAQMKAVALGLLFGAFALYVLATAMEGRHLAWGYLGAAAEAAMVGALADWFAVVALFRHPLGLPVPHTAIIMANKDRLGDQLARFLDEHFLAPDHLALSLARVDVSSAMSDWLQRDENTQRLASWMREAAPGMLEVLDQTAVREWAADLARKVLERVELATLGGQALEALVAHQHHQQWLDQLLQQLADWAAQDNVQEHFTDAIAKELRQLKYVGLDQAAARLATRKLVAALSTMLDEVAQDAVHPMRKRFDQWMIETAERLQHDQAWQARVALWRDTWLAQPGWQTPIEKGWHELMLKLRDEAQQPDGRWQSKCAELAAMLGQRLKDDASLRDWVNVQARQVLQTLLQVNRGRIVGFVSERVHAWDARELSDVLESHIGRDLQFIRVNGTVVGAMVGLALHAVTMGVLSFPAVQAWLH